MNKIPTQEEYENAPKGDTDLNKKIIKLGKFNELAFEDHILSINTSSSFRKVAFGLVQNSKSVEFPQGNCKIAWDRLVCKYAPYTAFPLFKLKSEFHNSKLESIMKGPNKWISNWKGFEFECANWA